MIGLDLHSQQMVSLYLYKVCAVRELFVLVVEAVVLGAVPDSTGAGVYINARQSTVVLWANTSV